MAGYYSKKGEIMFNCFSDYRAYTGTAPDAYLTIPLAFKSRGIEITALDQAITIRFQRPDGTYGDEITYDPATMAFPFGPIPWQTSGFMVRNTVAGVVGRYQIVEYK